MARGRFENARYDHQRLSAVEGTVREGLWRRDGRRVAPRTLLLVSIVERQLKEISRFGQSRDWFAIRKTRVCFLGLLTRTRGQGS